MPIITSIARHFAWRCILISIGSLVLGLWGVYDYVYSIPARERHVERGEVCRLVKAALEQDLWDENIDEARTRVQDHLHGIRQEHFSAVEARLVSLEELDEEEVAEIEAEFEAAIEAIRERNEEDWLIALVLFDRALKEKPREYPLTGIHLMAYEVADRGAQAVANVKPPRAYDRPTQWAFIACLPFFPLYLWFFFDAKRRVYRLDGDGTLHVPEGVWSAEEIADIDMSRWMAKSIAYVVHKDGTRVKLDDYKHRNLHLIIGAIASRLYPDQWDAEAKRVTAEGDEDSVEPEAASTAETT